MPPGFGTVPDDDPRRLLSSGRTRSPFAGGGGTGGPPAFSGGSEAISRGTGGGFTAALAPYNPPAGLPPSPEAMWNWGTSKYQLPLGNDRLGLWSSGPATGQRSWLGEVQGPFQDPGGFQQELAKLTGTPAQLVRGEERPPPWDPTEGAFSPDQWTPAIPGTGPQGPEPQGVTFNENRGEQDVPLTAGVLRSLGIPANKVSASAPRDVVQAGGGAISDYIAGTQPQVTQVHQPEWWESGPLGTLISLVPVIGGIQQIAKSLPKGNIGGGLAGIASILASAVGGIGGMPGAGGPAVGEGLTGLGMGGVGDFFGLGAGAGGAQGFEGAANAVGEVAGGSAGLTGGGFTGGPPAPFPTGPAPFPTTGSSAYPGAAGMSMGRIAPTAAEQAAGTGPFGMGAFGSPPTPGFWEGTPEALGSQALGMGRNLLGSAGGPSGMDTGMGGGGFAGEAAGMGGGQAGAQSGGQTGASRAAGAGGPLDMPGTMQETPETLEQRGRAQAMQRFSRGAPVGGFGRMM